MKIEVYGSGCPTCKKLYDLTKEAVNQLNINVEVQYITDVQKMVKKGIMSSPALVIDDNPILTGTVPSIVRIRELLEENIKK